MTNPYEPPKATTVTSVKSGTSWFRKFSGYTFIFTVANCLITPILFLFGSGAMEIGHGMRSSVELSAIYLIFSIIVLLISMGTGLIAGVYDNRIPWWIWIEMMMVVASLFLLTPTIN
jgi:hypothetical protein